MGTAADGMRVVNLSSDPRWRQGEAARRTRAVARALHDLEGRTAAAADKAAALRKDLLEIGHADTSEGLEAFVDRLAGLMAELRTSIGLLDRDPAAAAEIARRVASSLPDMLAGLEAVPIPGSHA